MRKLLWASGTPVEKGTCICSALDWKLLKEDRRFRRLPQDFCCTLPERGTFLRGGTRNNSPESDSEVAQSGDLRVILWSDPHFRIPLLGTVICLRLPDQTPGGSESPVRLGCSVRDARTRPSRASEVPIPVPAPSPFMMPPPEPSGRRAGEPEPQPSTRGGACEVDPARFGRFFRTTILHVCRFDSIGISQFGCTAVLCTEIPHA